MANRSEPEIFKSTLNNSKFSDQSNGTLGGNYAKSDNMKHSFQSNHGFSQQNYQSRTVISSGVETMHRHKTENYSGTTIRPMYKDNQTLLKTNVRIGNSSEIGEQN